MRNQSLANLAKSSITPLILAVGLLAGLSAVATETVYKWKDSAGHSHYSQQPPEGIKYQTITTAGNVDENAQAQQSGSTDQPPSAPQADSGPTPAQVARQKMCESARANVTTLNTHATVVSDVNNDGKPVTLNVAQHDSALNDANRQVALYCE